jgi:hypothetical protein
MYAADRLLVHYGDGVAVDIIERLPTPFGLVRSGVGFVCTPSRVSDRLHGGEGEEEEEEGEAEEEVPIASYVRPPPPLPLLLLLLLHTGCHRLVFRPQNNVVQSANPTK